MKKILYICSEYSTGMIPYGANIVNAMISDNVYAVFVSKGKLSYSEIVKPNTRYTFIEIGKSRLSSLLFKLFPLKLLFAIKKISEQEKIDVIHFLTAEYVLGYYVFFFSKRKLFYTVHDAIPHYTIKLSQLLSKKNLYELFFLQIPTCILQRYCDNLVTNSSEQVKYLENKFKNKKVLFHQFPSLVSTKMVNGTKCCPELINERNYILYFGTIHPYKGVDLLYQAYVFNEKVQKYKLVIAGKGNINFNMKGDIADRVILINRFIQDDELRFLFENAKCIVYPYRTITQSGVLSLAYYFHTPLLISDLQFFDDSVIEGETALLFEKGEFVDLSCKLSYLLENIDLEAMKNAQLEYYKRHFSVEALKQQLYNIYDKCNYE